MRRMRSTPANSLRRHDASKAPRRRERPVRGSRRNRGQNPVWAHTGATPASSTRRLVASVAGGPRPGRNAKAEKRSKRRRYLWLFCEGPEERSSESLAPNGIPPHRPVPEHCRNPGTEPTGSAAREGRFEVPAVGELVQPALSMLGLCCTGGAAPPKDVSETSDRSEGHRAYEEHGSRSEPKHWRPPQESKEQALAMWLLTCSKREALRKAHGKNNSDSETHVLEKMRSVFGAPFQHQRHNEDSPDRITHTSKGRGPHRHHANAGSKSARGRRTTRRAGH